MLNKIKKTGQKGYTLIEMLVGVSVMVILIAASVDFFVSSLRMQQKALATQLLLDNTSYSMEYMSRALRMAKRDTDGDCITAGKNYETTTSPVGIKFLSYHDDCWQFYKTNARNAEGSYNLMLETTGGPKPIKAELTSKYLDLVSFKIWQQEGLSQQPRVTLFLEAQMIKNKKAELRPSIKIQTTISERDLSD